MAWIADVTTKVGFGRRSPRSYLDAVRHVPKGLIRHQIGDRLENDRFFPA